MNRDYQPTSETPTAKAAAILNDFFMGALREDNIGAAYGMYAECADAWALVRLREMGFERQIREKTDDYGFRLTIKYVAAEEMEDTPVYDAYYESLGIFNRKVLTVCAGMQ